MAEAVDMVQNVVDQGKTDIRISTQLAWGLVRENADLPGNIADNVFVRGPLFFVDGIVWPGSAATVTLDKSLPGVSIEGT